MRDKINTEQCSEVEGDCVWQSSICRGLTGRKREFTPAAGREVVI